MCFEMNPRRRPHPTQARGRPRTGARGCAKAPLGNGSADSHIRADKAVRGPIPWVHGVDSRSNLGNWSQGNNEFSWLNREVAWPRIMGQPRRHPPENILWPDYLPVAFALGAGN